MWKMRPDLKPSPSKRVKENLRQGRGQAGREGSGEKRHARGSGASTAKAMHGDRGLVMSGIPSLRRGVGPASPVPWGVETHTAQLGAQILA